MTGYEELLDRAREGLPKQSAEDVRFEMPRFVSFMEGSKKTIIKNFSEVAKTLNRKPEHLQKYIATETGAPGEIEGPRLLLKGRKTNDFLNQKLEAYVNEFVFCEQCKKPDTEIRKQGGVPIIKCGACGAKYSIRKI